MGEKKWACATCSQGFTRAYGADRHIRNLHSVQAKKVRFINYIAGRLSREFSPADPLAYGHKKKEHNSSQSHVISYEHNNSPDLLCTRRSKCHSSEIGGKPLLMPVTIIEAPMTIYIVHYVDRHCQTKLAN
jgi:hypothetical protein